MALDPIELGIFSSRLTAVCEEMGVRLRNAAFSTNIRDRLDFSCAVFDGQGRLCAQAAHIPVHLGSMAYAMASIVAAVDWAPGDMVVLNDPYLGGTHLPDVTLIAPLFPTDRAAGQGDGTPIAFLANRAHHADIGATAPGSMPVSRSLDEEGLVIAPTHLVRGGEVLPEVLEAIVGATRDPGQARGDFLAQVGANRAGIERLGLLVDGLGPARYRGALNDLNDYGERLARASLAAIPAGVYRFEDWLDDDGQGTLDIPIRVGLEVSEAGAHLDFAGTAPQVPGNINCPLSVAAAAVLYCFRCLMPPQTPACAGTFRPITLEAPLGSLLNARRPAAVAAGNVETSTRVVDVVLGALAQAIPERIPAASHGSMNNLALGSHSRSSDPAALGTTTRPSAAAWGPDPGRGLVRCPDPHDQHPEYPHRGAGVALSGAGAALCTQARLRRGAVTRPGGDGLVREIELLAPAQVTLLTERRRFAPWGLAGGEPGAARGQPVERRRDPGQGVGLGPAG